MSLTSRKLKRGWRSGVGEEELNPVAKLASPECIAGDSGERFASKQGQEGQKLN